MGARLAFTAHCQRGHDRIDFTDRDDFTAHMKGEHKAHVRTGVSQNKRWAAHTVKAAPWKAPKAPATTEKLTAVLLEASGSWSNKYNALLRSGDDLDPDWTTDDMIPPADLEPGDVFVMPTAPGVRYAVLETDPGKGWHVELVGDHSQAGSARRAWLAQIKLPRDPAPAEAVVRVGRKAA